MSIFQPSSRGVLYIITCAAPPAQRIHEFVLQAQEAGRKTCVIATPHALKLASEEQWNEKQR